MQRCKTHIETIGHIDPQRTQRQKETSETQKRSLTRHAVTSCCPINACRLSFTSLNQQITWVDLDPLGSTWVHLGPLGSTWIHLGLLGSTWVQLGPLGSNWVQLVQLGYTWVHLGPIGSNWVQLGPIGSTWVHLGPFGSTCVQVGPHGSTWVYSGPLESTRVHLIWSGLVLSGRGWLYIELLRTLKAISVRMGWDISQTTTTTRAPLAVLKTISAFLL